jgi:predicted deacylase
MTTKVAGLEIKPGSKISSSLSIGNRAASHVDVPFTITGGAKDGPTLCVTAGVHGTEYAGIEGAIRVAGRVKPEDLSGTLIVVPVVNVPAFEARTYVSPIDGVNMQGSYPGKPDGTITQLIAFRVFNEFVSKSNYYLDLHGGDIHESEVGFAAYFETGDSRIDAQSEQMARALGFEYVWRTSEEGPMPKGSTWRTGPESEIPSALAELSSGDKLLSEEASAMSEGILNVMRQLRMLGGEPRRREEQKVLTQFTPLTVKQGGLFHPHVMPGSMVSEGDILGEVTNLQGAVIDMVRAPTKGVVLVLIHNPVVNPGDKTIYLGSTTKTEGWSYA